MQKLFIKLFAVTAVTLQGLCCHASKLVLGLLLPRYGWRILTPWKVSSGSEAPKQMKGAAEGASQPWWLLQRWTSKEVCTAEEALTSGLAGTATAGFSHCSFCNDSCEGHLARCPGNWTARAEARARLAPRLANLGVSMGAAVVLLPAVQSSEAEQWCGKRTAVS